MKKSTLLIAPILILSFACANSKKTGASNKNGDNYITYQRGACFGRCPMDEITFFENGNVKYNGKRFVERIGIHEGSVKRDSVSAWLKEFNDLKFFELDSIYEANITDLPTFKMVMSYNGQIDSTQAIASYPDNLRKIFKRLNSFYKLVEWDTPLPEKKEPLKMQSIKPKVNNPTY